MRDYVTGFQSRRAVNGYVTDLNRFPVKRDIFPWKGADFVLLLKRRVHELVQRRGF